MLKKKMEMQKKTIHITPPLSPLTLGRVVDGLLWFSDGDHVFGTLLFGQDVLH